MLIGTNADEVRYWIREMSYSVDGIPFLSGLRIYMYGMIVMLENNLFELSGEEKRLVKKFMARLRRKHIWNVTEYFNEVLFRIPAMEQAVRHASAGGKSYTYFWTQRGANKMIGASHAIELSYIFNNPEEVIYTGNVYNEELGSVSGRTVLASLHTQDPADHDPGQKGGRGQGSQERTETASAAHAASLLQRLLLTDELFCPPHSPNGRGGPGRGGSGSGGIQRTVLPVLQTLERVKNIVDTIFFTPDVCAAGRRQTSCDLSPFSPARKTPAFLVGLKSIEKSNVTFTKIVPRACAGMRDYFQQYCLCDVLFCVASAPGQRAADGSRTVA